MKENYVAAIPCIRNETLPKIIINNTVHFYAAISILLTSNHNSFPVLFDKIASVYFIKNIFIFLH